MSNPYLVQMARDHHYDRFLQSQFVPPPARERILTLLALDAELAHVRAHVREEMLGHIRYAWWEESLTTIAEGKKPREHPVLQAIGEHHLTAPALQRVQLCGQTYPNPVSDVLDLSALVPAESQQTWDRVGNIIASHRQRFGKKWNSWLMLKLLFAVR